MAKIIPFPNHHKEAGDMVEEIIAERLPHQPPEIQQCLKTEMTQLVKKYFSAEELPLSLVLPPDLSETQFLQIEQGIRNTINTHHQQMNQRTNKLFFELCLSRMTICELRYQLQKGQ